MTEKKKGILCLGADSKLEKAQLILTLILSLVIFVAAISYVVSCVSIYTSGEDTPFSRGVVVEHLKKLLPISLTTLALVICVGVLSLFTTEKKVKSIPIKSKIQLKLIEKKLSKNYSEEYSSQKNRESKLRGMLIIIASVLSVVMIATALVFVLDSSRYSLDNVNLDIAHAVIIAAVAAVLVFADIFVLSLLLDRSYSRECSSAKSELARQKAAGISPTPCEEYNFNEGHTVFLVRLTLIAVAITFIILGITNGGMADVLGKAVRICTECIGLG